MWIRGRSLRPGRNDDEDEFQLDFTKDYSENVRDILTNICKRQGSGSERRRLSYLNAFVKLLTKCEHDYSKLGFSAEEILYCLRPALLHDTTQVRSGGLRALRYMLRSSNESAICVKLQYPLLIARSLDLITGNDNERVQAIRVVRRLMCINAAQFPVMLARTLVAIASGTEDRLLHVSLAALAELCILNPDLFISVGGVATVLRSLASVRSARMAECLVGCLLFLQNNPETRKKAAINLDCLAAPYTDLQAVDKTKENTSQDRFKWAHITLLSTLRSWPGVLHFCHPLKDGLRSIVATLYLNQLDVRKAVLDLLYELLCLAQPEWSDEMSVALEAVDPSRTQEAFKLSEGFVAAEGKMVLPHLSKCRVNLSELHLSLLLYCFLEVGLLDAVVEVIIAEDTFLSVRATILLGELLHLIHLLLPPECCHLTPSLPNLLSYAVRGRPHPIVPPTYVRPELPFNKEATFTRFRRQSGHSSARTVSESSTEKTGKQDVQTLSEGFNMCSGNEGEFQDNPPKPGKGEKIENLLGGVREVLSDMTNTGGWYSGSGGVESPPSSRAQQRALSAVSALSRLHRLLRLRPAPASLHLDHVLASVAAHPHLHAVELARAKGKTHSRNKLGQVLTKECDEAIKDSGVLTNKDCFAWNWDIIRAVLKSRPECLIKCEENTHKQFLRRLVQFVTPLSRQMSKVDFSGDRRSVNIYTLTAMELFDCLLLGAESSECSKMMVELITALGVEIEAISTSKSAHDCLFSPQAVLNSLCQDYFLLVGHLSRSQAGCDILDQLGVVSVLLNLATTSKHDCYVKLVISSLDYSSDHRTRNIMSSTLVCEQVSSRLYATKFLRVLLRTPLSKHEGYVPWVIELLANQLSDSSRAVSLSAIAALDEACDCKEYLEALINLRPSLLHLGDKGLLLLIRFLSTEIGFSYMKEANIVSTQLANWVKFNYKYVCIVEGELADGLSLVERNEDGRLSSRLSNAKRVPGDIYVPPHLYGQLAHHQAGLNTLLADENIPKLTQVVLRGNCRSESEVMDLKAALWALGHFSSCPGGALWARANGVTRAFVSLACHCPVYAVRSTAFHCIALTSTNSDGADTLLALGWHTVRHNRSDLWPVVAPLSLLEDAFLLYQDDARDSSDSSTTEMMTKSGLFILGEDSTMDENESFIGFTASERAARERKAATLPPAGSTHTYHHSRSYSESKADSDWPQSNTLALSNSGSDITDFRSSDIPRLLSESSTSGTSSGGESYQPRTYLSDKIMQTLSPIPSTGSLTTIKSHRKISTTSSQGPQLSPKDMVGLAALRSLHRSRRPTLTASPQAQLTLHFSQSAPVTTSPLSPIDFIAFQDWKQMSPLVRPKHTDSSPIEPQFEVSGVHCPLLSNSDKPQALHYESSRNCIAQPLEDPDDGESNGPCYQGICLPQNLVELFPTDEVSGRSEDLHQDNNSTTGMDVSSCDSETDTGPEPEGKPRSAMKRRHDRAACLLCSVTKLTNTRPPRWRKVSNSSLHRTRTETESSYGGAGNEGESPVMLPWPNKAGLENIITSVDSSSTDITSVAQRSLGDNFKSRSVVRKEVLRLAEQLCNPILYKTCKQALLQLKQTYSDVFNDICVYSDVCAIMATAPHRIYARRFLQELFLDAPFSELYEDSLGILSVQNHSESEEGMCVEKPVSGHETVPSEDTTDPNIRRTPGKKNGFDSEQRSGQNYELEVIPESDTRSENSDLCRASVEKRRHSWTQDSLCSVSPPEPKTVSVGVTKILAEASHTQVQDNENYKIMMSKSCQQLRKDFFNTPSSPGAILSESSPNSNLSKNEMESNSKNDENKSLPKRLGKEVDSSNTSSLTLTASGSSNESTNSKPKCSLPFSEGSSSALLNKSVVTKSPQCTKKGQKTSNIKTNLPNKSKLPPSTSSVDHVKSTIVEVYNPNRDSAISKTKSESKLGHSFAKTETVKVQLKPRLSTEGEDYVSSSSKSPCVKTHLALSSQGKPPSGSNRQRKKATSKIPNRESLDSKK